ncbi:efflux RND transporter periplasmic adaptor subunit [Phenylobacterium sp.]|uniref:efflux RND transporter periplasmic adaptor subunit n=1 Tax=Phenylobacterium sp. TaxID=1871053 RepID=UPI002731725D|nr:efflux RND transporter periplasmic adaptor subunit [Phenylobacterium sp.]MDP2214113.1 efflux RND transporter periplasmic adaptor subunit [Phenylobacterium sp.]
MTGRARLRLAAIVLLLAAIAAVALVMSRRPPEVAVLTLRPQATELVLAVVGRVRPLDLVEVRSPNPGQVIELLADDGDQVVKGQPLALIRAAVEEAQTEADAARVRAAQAETAEARLAYQRTETLARQGFAAQAALDQARARLRSAQAAVAAAQATARASAARSREFVVRAPMAGIILVRPIDGGQVVTPTTTLFELGSLDGVEILAEVDEAYADALRPGMVARAAASGAETRFEAVVSEVSPKIDSSTGGRQVKVRPQAAVALAPGRSVDVTIVVEVRDGALVIPRQAVVDATTAPKAYVLDAQDVVVARNIVIARWPSQGAIIEQGLAPGDRVVLTPAGLRPGDKVAPVSPPDAG